MDLQGGKIKNVKDFRWEPLYDTYTIGNAALTTLTNRFFSTPISGTKQKYQTNMVAASQLPSPQVFRCYGIKARAISVDTRDSRTLGYLCMDSWIRFFVGTKDYLITPLAKVAGKVYSVIDGLNSAAGAQQGSVSFGAPEVSYFKFPANGFIDILSTENFGVEWTLNTSFTLNASVNLVIELHGYRGVEVR